MQPQAAETDETPSFPSRDLTGELSIHAPAAAGTDARNISRTLGVGIFGLLALAWIALVVWDGERSGWYAESMQFVLHAAAIVAPLLLLLLIALELFGRDADPIERLERYAGGVGSEAAGTLTTLTEARATLLAAREELALAGEQAMALSEARAEKLAGLVGRVESASDSLAQSINRTLPVLSAIGEEAPLVEGRLNALVSGISRYGESLSEEAARLDGRLRDTALAAEDAQLRLSGAHDEAVRRLAAIGEAARSASEELTASADIATARADIARERLRAAMTETTSHFDTIHAHGERSGQQLAALQPLADALLARLATLNDASEASVDRIAQASDRLAAALASNVETTAAASQRGEALLLALDSALRDLDESLPGALERADRRLGDTQARVDRLGAGVENAAKRLEWAGDNIAGHAATLNAAVTAADASLTDQGERIATLRAEIETLGASLARLARERAPEILRALEGIETKASEATRKAQAEIETLLKDKLSTIGEAGGAALEAAFRTRIEALVGDLAEAADQAAQAAQHATDQLIRQMATLSESASSLEARVQDASQEVATQDRDSLTSRSAQIIAALNDNAIDIAKWLGHEVGEKEWASYLAGDKSLFSRRAVRLLSGNDTRQVHALYDVDPAFREHVNRYVAAFEGMLHDILKGRDGHSLAITLLSSDIGKLYVALAQAIERLRVA